MGLEAQRNVQRLRPLRVMLSMSDRRCMRVTAFLLARRGYDVVQDGGRNPLEAATRARSDVVVLEAQGSRAEAARMLATLAASNASPGVVAVVADDLAKAFPGIPTVSKWTPIDELAREIDAVSLSRGAPAAQRTSFL